MGILVGRRFSGQSVVFHRTILLSRRLRSTPRNTGCTHLVPSSRNSWHFWHSLVVFHVTRSDRPLAATACCNTEVNGYNIFRWYRAGWCGGGIRRVIRKVCAEERIFTRTRATRLRMRLTGRLGVQLYRYTYPPNTPPRGCEATPWQAAADRISEYQPSRAVWCRVSEEPFEVGSEEPEGHAGTNCKCEYELIGVESYYQSWEQFQRTITCCGVSARQSRWFARKRWKNLDPHVIAPEIEKTVIAPFDNST
jgi:hypothetical protein